MSAPAKLRASLRKQLAAAFESDELERSAETIGAKVWPRSRAKSSGKRIRAAVDRGWASPDLLVPLARELGFDVEINLVPRSK